MHELRPLTSQPVRASRTSRVKTLASADAVSTIKQLLEAFVTQADIVQLRFSPERVTQLGHAIAHVATLLKDVSAGD